jgi:hypothetical protein
MVALVLVATLYPATLASATRSPPAWVKIAHAVCPNVDLTKTYASGQSGPLAGGYNVYLLEIVARSGVSCARARTLSSQDWLRGHHGPLSWRLRRSWNASSGSGYVGDYRGTAPGTTVEYYAVH